MKKKCVFAIGPESTGSMLVAKIISHVLEVHQYGDWDGVGWSDKGSHKVCHRSLPYGFPSKFPDVDKWIKENETEYDIYFVLTTRDITVSESSRIERFSKNPEQVKEETGIAKDMMLKIMKGEQKYFLWSYETFMFLKLDYLKLLYDFLKVDSAFIPPLFDGNKKRVRFRNKPSLKKQAAKYLKTLKGN